MWCLSNDAAFSRGWCLFKTLCLLEETRYALEKNFKNLTFSNTMHYGSNKIGTHDHLVRKRTLNHLAKLANWAVLWVLIRKKIYNCTFECMLLHVTYAFQSESTLYSYLNAKELLARNRHDMWSLNIVLTFIISEKLQTK